MKIQRKIAVLPLALVLVGGCAAVPTAPAVVSTGTASAVNHAIAPVASETTETAAIRKTARLLGLTPRSKDGTELYCRAAAAIGTRLESTTCYTNTQVLDLEKRKQSNQDDVDALRRASLTEPNKH